MTDALEHTVREFQRLLEAAKIQTRTWTKDGSIVSGVSTAAGGREDSDMRRATRTDRVASFQRLLEAAKIQTLRILQISASSLSLQRLLEAAKIQTGKRLPFPPPRSGVFQRLLEAAKIQTHLVSGVAPETTREFRVSTAAGGREDSDISG